MTDDAGRRRDLVPLDRLPEGVARRLDRPPDPPAPARPASTLVLIRPGPETDGADPGLEVLLLRRSSAAPFVPGAWVFPGGAVEPADGAPSLLRRLDGASGTADRPGSSVPGSAADDPPTSAHYTAAVREAFEETGLLLARSNDGSAVVSVRDDEGLAPLRRAVQHDAGRFADVLERTDRRIDAGGMAYIAHWVTPALSSRRYDTRFFAAVVPRTKRVAVDGTEVTEATWLRPAEALERRRTGELPMILPTVRTLESLRGLDEPGEVLHAFADRTVPRVLPRFVWTDDGPALLVPEGDPEGV